MMKALSVAVTRTRTTLHFASLRFIFCHIHARPFVFNKSNAGVYLCSTGSAASISSASPFADQACRVSCAIGVSA